MISAVDIGGTKIAVAAVDPSGRVVARTEWSTLALAPQGAVERIAQELSRLGHPFQGIGIGCTGPVDPFSGVVGKVDLLPGWEGCDLVRSLAAATGLTVALENDADAAAMAESIWGAGKGARCFLYVTVGTGIGVGMIFEGSLYRGVDGAHPEAGHQSLDPAGPLCYCGASGCWESLASGPAMAHWFASILNRASAPELTAHEICNLARQGDERARRAVEREAEYLGLGLANLVSIFCPDIIALGGGLMESADLFLPHVSQKVRRLCSQVPAAKVAIVPAALGGDAPLLGAAAVWLARFPKSESKISAA